MRRLEERDLRSLERPSLYSIFRPLEEDDPLPRDLQLEDKALPTRAGELAVWGFRRRSRRRQARPGAEFFVPAMFMFVRRFG